MSAPSKRAAGPTCVRTTHGGARVELPMPGDAGLVSEANAHEHYRERSNRAALQRAAVGATLRVMAGAPPVAPCRVVITRIAARALDTDNLTGSAKHVRDAVAAWLGVDDRDPRVEWLVAQEKGDAPAVRVEVTPVVPWSLAAVSARVVLEGPETVAELTLDPTRLRTLARQLDALADGARKEPVTFASKGALTRLRFHLLQETPDDAR